MSFRYARSATMIESNEHAVTVDDLISAAFDILEQAKLGTPILNEDGQPILCDGEPIFVPDLDSANRAIEVIGRLAGFWIERREVITRPRAMADWTDTQLQAEQDQIHWTTSPRASVIVVSNGTPRSPRPQSGRLTIIPIRISSPGR